VALFTSDVTVAPEGERFGFRPVYKRVFGQQAIWRRTLRFAAGTLTALVAAVRERRTVCHLHFFGVGPLEFLNVLMARVLFRRVVITAHDVEAFVTSLDAPGLPRLAYRLAHGVIAHNQVSREELIERLGLDANRIAVIPAGNHLASTRSLVSRDHARRALALPAVGHVLLFFGQIKRVKGLEVLLRAMPAILEAHPEVTLLIAGRPWKTDFAEYQAQIDELGIKARCATHIRFIPDAELPLYYAACDLVVLPYLRIYQSDVVLMAMSYGKAVLTSNIPGMMEIVRHGETGFLFRSGDEADLARVVGEVLRDPGLLDSVAEQGRTLMVEAHGWPKIGQTTLRFYESLE
jgi:glycosyltransferase involved in cell wall biosynthesis